MKMLRPTLRLLALALAACMGWQPAVADDAADPADSAPSGVALPMVLEGTLARISQTGTVALGYRDASLPFSYLDAQRRPVGYSIDLCRAVVRTMETSLHKPLQIIWVAVTSENRIGAVTDQHVDLECGSTTNNLERQQRVAFSPTFFIAGTKLLVRKGSGIRTWQDLAGKKVAVTSGTTNQKTLHDLSVRHKLGLALQPMRDHAESFAQVSSGKAAALAGDDVLLHGFIATHRAPNGSSPYIVVGDYLSYDPYGLMYRKNDPQMARLVNTTFRTLAANGDMERLYTRWFLRRMPNGITLNLPMSPHLESALRATAAGAP